MIGNVLVWHDLTTVLRDLDPLVGEGFSLPCLVDYAWNTLELAVLGRVVASKTKRGIELSLGDVGGGEDGDVALVAFVVGLVW